VPAFEPRTYQILIKDNRFEPEILKIEKGSIVEWRVSSSQTGANGLEEDETEDFSNQRSNVHLYSSNTRRHVIAFESAQLAQTESPLLRSNDTFKVRFLEVGSYPYRCQIFPRMKGNVRVFENVHQIISSTIPRNPHFNKQAVFALGPSHHHSSTPFNYLGAGA